MYVFIHSALAEFPVCTDAGGPELGRALRIHSLVEWLKVSLFTCGALCRMHCAGCQGNKHSTGRNRMCQGGWCWMGWEDVTVVVTCVSWIPKGR